MPGSPYILIVEPDVLVRQPVAEYLRECGYKVVGDREHRRSTSGRERRYDDDRRRPRRHPSPRKTGRIWAGPLDEAKSAKRRELMLAGTVANEAKEAGDLCEDGPFLSKPYDPQLLVDRIKRAIATRDRINKP